jgi:glutamate/tyrosine decarboxylase-like PLP-dependent enzyme
MPESDDLERLQLPAEQMRELGYRVIDMLVEHFENLPSKQVTRKAPRRAMEERLREPIPERGLGVDAVLRRLERDVLGNMMHLDHPRFFAFIPGPSNYVAAMAEALATGFNVFAGTWLEASGPAQIELVTVDWLRQICGMPEGTNGLFVSGGSMANLTALVVARQAKLPNGIEAAMVYCSDQTHSSIEKGMGILGFRPEQLRKLTSDESFRLPLAELRRAVGSDRASGKIPFCVVANAGTTNTGAVDPLADLADYCREEGLWFHVDGAYGAAAVLSEREATRLAGMARADSLSLDPHKWLFQPYETGCVLIREGRRLRQ